VVVALSQVTPITDVSIGNYSKEGAETWAREVEVEVSATSSYKDFVPIGQLSMPAVGDLYTISLPAPVSAKYVRVFFRSNGGGSYMEAGRIRVYQTDSGPGPTLGQQLAETGRAVVREIRFATNSAEILPESGTVLGQIVKLLQDDPKLELIIEGHTDSVGGAPVNLELSRRRAEAVKRWLVYKGGIGEIRLTTVGYGLTRPVADNATEEGRTQNRRVELVRR
jgi:outer membrane protein OmpA-like peptidoglycan-associated protein